MSKCLLFSSVAVVLSASACIGQQLQNYPGCPTPSGIINNIWYFDPVNGKTETAWTTAGVPVWTPSSGPAPAAYQGDINHPWNDLNAVGWSSSQAGYKYPLLTTAPYVRNAQTGMYGPGPLAGPIAPGDEILLNTGNYGVFSTGSQYGGTNNGTGWLTIAPAPGQSPLLTGVATALSSGFVFEGLTVQNIQTTSYLVQINTGTNTILDNLTVENAPPSVYYTWTAAQWLASTSAGVKFSNGSCNAITNSNVDATATPLAIFGNQVLAQNNNLHHFGNDGIDHGGSSELIQGNTISDALNYIPGEHQDGMQEYGYSAPVTNVVVNANTVIRQFDPNINPSLVTGYLQCIDDYGATQPHNGLTVTNNRCITAGGAGIHFEAVNNGVISNNTVICDQVPCTTPPGIYLWAPGTNSNVQMDNNISGSFTIANQDPNVTANNNYTTYDGSPGGAVIVDEVQNPTTGAWTTAYYGEGGAPYLWLGTNRMSTQQIPQVFNAFTPVTNGQPAVIDLHIQNGTEASTFGSLALAPPMDIQGAARPTTTPVQETVYTPTTVVTTANPAAAPVAQPPCTPSDTTVNGVETIVTCPTQTIAVQTPQTTTIGTTVAAQQTSCTPSSVTVGVVTTVVSCPSQQIIVNQPITTTPVGAYASSTN